MSRGALALLAAAALSLVAGCGGRPAPHQPGAPVAQQPSPEDPARAPRHPALTIRNGSSAPICFVHISRAGAEHWGPDRLGPSEVIDPGGARGWGVPAGTYDVRLLGCDRRPLLDRRGLVVDDQGLLVTLN